MVPIAILVPILLVLFIMICSCFVYFVGRENQSESSYTATDDDPSLDPELLSSLPVFVALDHKLECMVCLSELKEGEEGRFLPRCLHSFHRKCIDVWFATHSTCPLCRSQLKSESPAIP